MEFELLCQRLSASSGLLKSNDQWPTEQLELCAEAGVFKWFVGESFGGVEVGNKEIVQGYIDLAASCLTTTFVITQRTGACKRIESSDNEPLKQELLPRLARGEIFATLGISHLTTSHRHLQKPALSAKRTGETTWKLNGFCPWVTGAIQADVIVTGAETESGEHVFFAVRTSDRGVQPSAGFDLVALSSSQTGRVDFLDVELSSYDMITPPVKPVASGGATANTGGLQTSALAIGLSQAAVNFVSSQAIQRDNLVANATAMKAELDQLKVDIFNLAEGQATCTREELRSAANSFVLRATQSALIAAKGAAFVDGHDVGRWCREALFFLVWSCPQNVSDANLCEFAGITA